MLPSLELFNSCDDFCQGWQYGTVRSEFEYGVPCTFNRTVSAYRTSVQFLKRALPVNRTLLGTFFTYRILQSVWLNKDPLMTYAIYVNVLFCLHLIRIMPKDKLKAKFLKKVNGSTQSESNFCGGEPV